MHEILLKSETLIIKRLVLSKGQEVTDPRTGNLIEDKVDYCSHTDGRTDGL